MLFGENGVAEGLTHGKLVIDMSSISPLDNPGVRGRRSTRLAATISTRRCRAAKSVQRMPRSRSWSAAANGVRTRQAPIRTDGQEHSLVGDNGDGQTCKVANQIIVALNIEAVGEALLFASQAGADPAKVREALMGGFASSRMLEVHGERMIKRTFEPGFRIELHQKDLNLALERAHARHGLPNTASAQQLFNACVAHGGKAWDHSAMVRALEVMANHEVGADAEGVGEALAGAARDLRPTWAARRPLMRDDRFTRKCAPCYEDAGKSSRRRGPRGRSADGYD